jgi:hypothetical protein
MRATLGSAASPDLAWLADILWGGLEGVAVTLNAAAPAGTSTVERYRVVPNARTPRMLVPDGRRAGAAALRAGAGTRSGAARFQRSAAAAALGAGTRGVAFRDRLEVHAASGAPPGERLAATLGQVLEAPVLLAVNVRPPSPSRKPVVQVVDETGRTLAYAKVGWSAGTDDRLTAEGGALTAMAASEGAVGVPRPRHLGTWRGHALIVTDPMPASLRRWRSSEPPPVAATREVVERLGSGGSAAFGDSPVRARLLTRWEDAARTGAEPALADAIGDLLDGLDRSADVELAHGGWHGDWSPWNLGLDGDRLIVWDWEHAGDDVPAGLDLPHFCFQTAFIGGGRPVADAYADAREAGAPLLRAFGCTPAQIELTLGVHVAEVGLRYLGAAVEGAPPNPRFAAGGTAAIAAETSRWMRAGR